MNSLILYPINIETSPNFVMRKAFAKHFQPFEEFDWYNLSKNGGLLNTQRSFLELLRAKKPDYCFMQLQNEANMGVDMIREMAKHTKIINWSGDVRQTKPWYDWFIAIGREIHLSLFSNETDPQILRDAGCRADYLQVGFDSVWYDRRDPSPGWPEIVYCANDYGNFQLSRYRADVALALTSAFGSRFRVFGAGWEKHGIKTQSINNIEEAQAYNSCKIAISVSNFSFERYYSDRLLRIMGCGAFALSHEFSGLEKDFIRGQNIVTFSNINHLLGVCNYYLDPANEESRKSIALGAYKTAHAHCTWDARMLELIELLKRHN